MRAFGWTIFAISFIAILAMVLPVWGANVEFDLSDSIITFAFVALAGVGLQIAESK